MYYLFWEVDEGSISQVVEDEGSSSDQVHFRELIFMVLVGWLVVGGAVRRVFPCATFEIKSESYHLIAKNLTELWPDFNLQQDRELRYIWWEIEFKLHGP